MPSDPPAATLADSLEILADSLAGLTFESLSETTLTAARQRIFDTTAATAIGLNTPEGQALLALDAGRSQPIRAVDDRIRLHVGATRTTEIDDIDIASCTTVGSVVVPVALATASAHDYDDRRLLTAVVAGYEAMTRLGRAIDGATILYRGVWPTHATAAFAAAATTAKLLELDPQTFTRALARALTMTNLLSAGAFATPTSRYEALGQIAAEGAAAARNPRAEHGECAEALQRFAARLNVRVDPARLTRYRDPDGRAREIDVKLFPTSRQALASVEAFLSLIGDVGEPDDIERIIVHVPGTYRDMVDRPNLPAQRIESMIGVQYAMALALFDVEALHDTLRTKIRDDDRIVSLMRKIEVRASSQLDTLFPRTWGSTVTVHSKSGRVVTQEVLEPAGGPSRALDWRKLGRKVARLFAASGLGNAQFVGRLLERSRLIADGDRRAVAAELLEDLSIAGTWSTSGGIKARSKRP